MHWYGNMDWPLIDGWSCEICSNSGLTWGNHPKCRCSQCHAHYLMHDYDNGRSVKVPILVLDEGAVEVGKYLWETYETPLDELEEEKWKEGFRALGLDYH